MCGVRGARGRVHETDLETSRLETTNSNGDFEIINDELEKTLFKKWCDFLWTMRQKKKPHWVANIPFQDGKTSNLERPGYRYKKVIYAIQHGAHKLGHWQSQSRIHATYIGGL